MSRPALALILILTLAAAGCLEQPPEGGTATSEAEFRLGGTLTKNATQEDVADLEARADAHGGKLFILESYPLQYDVRGFSKAACEDLRSELVDVPYVATVGECAPVTHVDDPDEPVSNASEDGKAKPGMP